MAKQINTSVEQAKVLADQLHQQGIDQQKIEEWLQKSGAVEKIMQDRPLLLQYFRVTRAGLSEIVDWKYGEDRTRALAAEVDFPTSARYQQYFSTDRNPGTVAGRDFMPEGILFGDQQPRLVEDGWMSPEQYENWQLLQQYGFFTNGAGTAEGSSGAPPPPASGGAPKNFGTGGGGSAPTSNTSASGGTSKAYGVGGGPKTLGTGAPPPPPPGGGAYPPPPPVPGGAGMGGGMPGAGGQWVDQGTVDYINSVENPAARMWLQGLLGDNNYANGVMANLVQSMENDRLAMNDLRRMMSGLDPTDPQDRQKLTELQYQLGDMTGQMQQKTDLLATARRKMTDRENLIKGLLDKLSTTTEAIIRNVRN